VEWGVDCRVLAFALLLASLCAYAFCLAFEEDEKDWWSGYIFACSFCLYLTLFYLYIKTCGLLIGLVRDKRDNLQISGVESLLTLRNHSLSRGDIKILVQVSLFFLAYRAPMVWTIALC
jgi:hypothetical protein